jgi:hypothetical protein
MIKRLPWILTILALVAGCSAGAESTGVLTREKAASMVSKYLKEQPPSTGVFSEGIVCMPRPSTNPKGMSDAWVYNVLGSMNMVVMDPVAVFPADDFSVGEKARQLKCSTYMHNMAVRVMLTEKGRAESIKWQKIGLADTGLPTTTWSIPDNTLDLAEITGIRKPAENSTEAVVEFTWKRVGHEAMNWYPGWSENYKDDPPEKGVAHFRLYDDGWRLVKVDTGS